MYYIRADAKSDGAYPPLQSHPAKGLLAFPDAFLPIFYPADKQAAGFVTIENDGRQVTSCTWDEEAYQAWAAGAAPPEPSENDTILDLLADHEYRLCMAELNGGETTI